MEHGPGQQTQTWQTSPSFLDLATYDLCCIVYVDEGLSMFFFFQFFHSFVLWECFIFPTLLTCGFDVCDAGIQGRLCREAASSRASSKMILTSRLQPRLLDVES